MKQAAFNSPGAMRPEYDVIVVGAGPAGASCALYAARAGLSVLLVDRKRFPRDKICGDFLPRRALACFQELGLVASLEAVSHADLRQLVLGAPSGRVATIPFRPAGVPPPGYVAYACRRRVLDTILVDAARSCADVREGLVVDDVLIPHGAVTGVRGHDEAGKEWRFTGRVVVGADGVRSGVARLMGLYSLEPQHSGAAIRGYYRGVSADDSTAEVYFLKSVHPGYLWLFPTGDGLVNVGVGMLRQALGRRQGGLRQALLEAVERPPLADRFRRAERAGPVMGWTLPLGSRRRAVHGDGFVLAGDAAGLVNPFSGEGIGNAMWSGRIAAHVVAAACSAGDTSADALAAYPRQLWHELGPELKVSHQLQRLGRFPALLNLVLGRAASRPEVADWLGRMLCGTVPKSALRSPLTYLRLLAS